MAGALAHPRLPEELTAHSKIFYLTTNVLSIYKEYTFPADFPFSHFSEFPTFYTLPAAISQAANETGFSPQSFFFLPCMSNKRKLIIFNPLTSLHRGWVCPPNTGGSSRRRGGGGGL